MGYEAGATEPEKEYYHKMPTTDLQVQRAWFQDIITYATAQRNAISAEIRQRNYTKIMQETETIHGELIEP